MSNQDDIGMFQGRLMETIAWCTPRADPADPQASLRSSALRPIHIIDRYEDDFLFDWHTVGVGQAAVAHMASKRAELLAENGQMSLALPAIQAGRLLLSELLESIDEALAQYDSKGFFDSYDVPPWDTWVWLIATPPHRDRYHDRVCLVSWVPPSLVPLAQEGIAVNPVGCLAWATDQFGFYPFITELHRAKRLF